MFDRKCKIIFINHGSTIYTEQNRLYDQDDYPPVNEKGKKEIEKIAQWLKTSNQNIDLIYTSSALRAIQSARIIAKNLKVDFEIMDNLFERRAGIWGGMTFNQIKKKHPDLFEEYQKNPCMFCQEGGESTSVLNRRISECLNHIVKDSIHKSILIITHTGVIQSAISTALGIPPENQERIYIPTGSATQINYYEGWCSLVYSAYTQL